MLVKKACWFTSSWWNSININKRTNFPSAAPSLSSFPMGKNSTPRKEAQLKGHLFSCFYLQEWTHKKSLLWDTSEPLLRYLVVWTVHFYGFSFPALVSPFFLVSECPLFIPGTAHFPNDPLLWVMTVYIDSSWRNNSHFGLKYRSSL